MDNINDGKTRTNINNRKKNDKEGNKVRKHEKTHNNKNIKKKRNINK